MVWQDVKVDVSSAASLQASLGALRDHPDPRMLDIVQLLATKPMQVHHNESLPMFLLCRGQTDVCNPVQGKFVAEVPAQTMKTQQQ